VGCSVAPGFEFAGFRFVAANAEHEAQIASAPEALRGQLRELL
jgi:predicted cupin superfamily sugar epimerase